MKNSALWSSRYSRLARYEASLAERRYAACDPDNRLIAAQLEKSWEAALRRVETCQARLDAVTRSDPAVVPPDSTGLADDLNAAWSASGVTMRTRQRLLRALVTDIIADVDEATREIVLPIHWRGSQHSQLRVRKPNSREHCCRTPDEALAGMRSMASRWSDEVIAASMSEAAALGVTHHRIRRLIQGRHLPAEQVVPLAPY